MFKVGLVTWYFEKIGTVLIELNNPLSVGDNIKFVKGNQELFSQVVESMQIEHEKVNFARRGDVIALRVNAKVEKGTEVFKTGGVEIGS